MNHQEIDQRSLAMNQIIAERLKANPVLLDTAKANLARWLQTCSANVRPALLEWEGILNRGLDDTLEMMLGTDENSARLRQSSPFAGEQFIGRKDRTRLIRDFTPER